MAVLFDVSARSIVVHCTECPTRDIVTSAAAAERWASEHALAVHPGERAARTALEERRRRRAVSLRQSA